jgi:hypothetical protein
MRQRAWNKSVSCCFSDLHQHGWWIGPHTAKLQENILFVLCSSARVGAGAAGLSAQGEAPALDARSANIQGSVLLKNPKAERATL